MRLYFFLSYSSLHRHVKQKISQSPGTIVYFQYPGKRGKNKLKQSEIEVKMIIKMKKHNLCSNWQIGFIRDTDEILVIKNLKEVHQIF